MIHKNLLELDEKKGVGAAPQRAWQRGERREQEQEKENPLPISLPAPRENPPNPKPHTEHPQP